MIDAIPAARQPEPTVSNLSEAKRAAFATSIEKPTQSQTPPLVDGTVVTVEISNAAEAALKDVLETAAQAAKGAVGGDHQAQGLLAREAAAKG